MKKMISIILSFCLMMSVCTLIPIYTNAVENDITNGREISGTTGECSWVLSNDGTLIISGSGMMGSYTGLYNRAPWGTNINKVS